MPSTFDTQLASFISTGNNPPSATTLQQTFLLLDAYQKLARPTPEPLLVQLNSMLASAYPINPPQAQRYLNGIRFDYPLVH